MQLDICSFNSVQFGYDSLSSLLLQQVLGSSLPGPDAIASSMSLQHEEFCTFCHVKPQMGPL